MKTTNKYPEFRMLSRAECETEMGIFDMAVFKEKCGQSYVVQFIQKSFKRDGKEYAFYKNPLIFKLKNSKMVYDPMNVIKSNFTETIKPEMYEIGYNGSIVHLNNHIEFAIRHLEESILGE